MFLILLFLTFILNYRPILASERNIFGLHLAEVTDIDSAHTIINSEGGDWGYVTIVMRLDQLDKNTWQDFFNKCRQYHLIPLIRVGTVMIDDYWKKPSLSDIDNIANFLNSLNWPTKDQHVILFNEVNHASEWGGEVNPKEYADLSIYFFNKLKQLNPNFFILNAPLDLAAPEKTPQFKSAPNFFREIYLYKPEFFDSFDGLASHSYPNHGFVGLPTQTGQYSIRGYQWELNYFKSLGVNRQLPVFITETGWPHREGQNNKNNFYTVETSSKFLLQSLNIWQKDPQIMAVTPFIYNFPFPPFDHFSWLKTDQSLYPSYQKIINTPKTKNHPEQITKYEIVFNSLPFILFTGQEYSGQLVLKNSGQSIWGETNFCLNPQTTINVTLEAICNQENLNTTPGQNQTFNYKIKISQVDGYTDKTFISWDGLPQLEIAAVNGSSTIYSPKTSLKDKIFHLLSRFFI